MAAASFTERFDFRAITTLSDDDASLALLRPALDVGVRWDPGAAETVLRAARGSPYLLQLMGDEIWNSQHPDRGGTLTPESAAEGLREVAESLETGMFRGRWSKATPAEQTLMIAMARVCAPDGWASSRHISIATGRRAQQFSMARQGLIDKGLVESRRGAMRFTMPGFEHYVLRVSGTGRLPPAQLEAPETP